MTEAAKVRVVRCPKCDNLLPEVEDLSLYQCGGCGAVLKGKNKGVDLDSFSENSDREIITEGIIMEKIVDADDADDNSENEASSSISSSSRRPEQRTIPTYRNENNKTPSKNNLKNSDYEADSTQGKCSDERQRANGSIGSGNLADGTNAEKGEEIQGHRRPNRMDCDGMRYSMDGSLRHDSVYENPSRGRNGNRMPEFNNPEHLGYDQVEALRKLDEIKDQLSRSGHLIGKGKEKVPLGPGMMYHNRYPREKQGPDTIFNRPPYQNHYAESFPSTKAQEMGGNRFYPTRYEYDEPGYVRGFGDRSHSGRRRPHQDYVPPYQPYVPGVVPSVDGFVPYLDNRKPYAPSISHHHPLCSCYHCLDNRQVPPLAYLDRYSYAHENRGNFVSIDYHDNRAASDPYVGLSDSGSVAHARWPRDVNSEVDGYVSRGVQRVQLTSSSKTQPLQHQLPIAGGAPFLTCYSCFELLVLPKRVEINDKQKIRCGACSTVITFVHSKESNSIAFSKESINNSKIKENLRNTVSPRGGKNSEKARPLVYSSDDSYDYGMANKFDEMKNRNSTSTCGSEVEEDRAAAASAAVKEEHKLTEDLRPPAGSPLLEHFEYSNKYHRGGNKSVQPEHGDVSLPKNEPFCRRNKQDSSATEIDLSPNEYANTGTTYDSGETSGEGEKLKHGGRLGESFLAGFLKRSVKDSNNRTSGSPKSEKANVTVNGHLIPDALVEKAQKLAGSIHPGNYWYDFRAGFWGVMGGPCLGIIPPFIEEFNYRMAEDCAGGNTQVYVNGRELNEKDLRLLASRGLPTESHRSYIIEISGRVLDEDTGDELENLGKLAPTVERAKRGFGMRARKACA